MSFIITHKDKKTKARIGILKTKSGNIETPFFMPVATKAAVKHISSEDLSSLGAKAIISNTFILHLSPGEKLIKKLGGIKKFMNFSGINATDSGGFQMYSPSVYLYSNERGVMFKNPFNGDKLLITPEKDMKIQLDLGSDIAMCLDEMPLLSFSREKIKKAVERTADWARRCKAYHEQIQKNKEKHKRQLLFGITQGGIYLDLRKFSAGLLKEFDFDGYAIGGLALGETKKQEYNAIKAHKLIIPESKPCYLMGSGNPAEILKAISLGVDMFDSRFPTQNARRGTLFTCKGRIRIFNKKNKASKEPIDKTCKCFVCRNYSKAYIAHLLKHEEGTGLHLATFHNLYFMQNLISSAKTAIKKGKFSEFKKRAGIFYEK